MEYIDAKTILTKCKSTEWFGTDYNMNIYRGCCHGCIYCDSRSECYNIDILFNFGISIVTKSALITRDIDILQNIKEHSPVICKLTITAADDSLCRKIEPHVSLSSERFEAMHTLSNHGIFSGVVLMPVLPFIEDNEENILNIIHKTAECGGKFIYPSFGVTLRQNQREYFFDKLDVIFPESNLREKYIRYYGNSYKCTVQNIGRLWKIFESECLKYGIIYKMKDIISAYKSGYEMSVYCI